MCILKDLAMIYHIFAPERKVNTVVELPASKSISNRVLILNALSYSDYPIENLSVCDDTEVLRSALESNNNHFDIHAAGTAMRFLTAFLAKVVGEWTITGTERMKQRPIRILVDALNSVGAKIEYMEKEGFPPLRIFGSALQGGEISLDGSVSSQYISALLMIAPLMEKGLTLRLSGKVISKPYISLTLQLMKQFGVTAKWSDNVIEVVPQEYKPVPFVVESDWSAASYWYEIAALSSQPEIVLNGLFKKSMQGDAVVGRLFERIGIGSSFERDRVKLRKNGNFSKRLNYDFTDEPDLAQTFVVTCALLGIPFRFSGLQSLKIKETDRIEALKAELKKFGYLLRDEKNSVLEWDGERCEPDIAPVVCTYEDHRMAMSFAPVALKLPAGIRIKEPEVVSKSYPTFWQDLQKAGFRIEKEE